MLCGVCVCMSVCVCTCVCVCVYVCVCVCETPCSYRTYKRLVIREHCSCNEATRRGKVKVIYKHREPGTIKECNARTEK